MPGSRRRERREQRARQDALAAELEQVRPYLDLAREIHHQVALVSADDLAPIESLVDAIARVPDGERDRVAREVFDRLTAEQQWEVVARAFGDDELRRFLADERASRLDHLHRRGVRDERLRRSRAEQRLDTTTLAVGEVLTLGLFRDVDVGPGLERGSASQSAARLLVLRREEGADGACRVLDDVFNPRGGYFVTAAYDESMWRRERFDSHTIVRVGAVTGGPSGPAFAPVLYPGARVDVERADARDGAERLALGRLHLGFAMVGGDDVFVA